MQCNPSSGTPGFLCARIRKENMTHCNRRSVCRHVLSLCVLVVILGEREVTGAPQPGGKSVQNPSSLQFTIDPRQGPTGGGTQVTITVSSDIPRGHNGNFWCKFGGKVVPSQSYFQNQDGKAIVCQAPSASPRVVPFGISLDGMKFYAGSKYHYVP